MLRFKRLLSNCLVNSVSKCKVRPFNIQNHSIGIPLHKLLSIQQESVSYMIEIIVNKSILKAMSSKKNIIILLSISFLLVACGSCVYDHSKSVLETVAPILLSYKTILQHSLNTSMYIRLNTTMCQTGLRLLSMTYWIFA